MLHLVGQNTDKDRVNYGVETGTLIAIARGIYVNADDDADRTLFDHAVRIAKYLYPNTYLAGVSAETLAPTPDGRLFLSGRRGQRTRLGNLEIIQTRAPGRPEIVTATLVDPLGEVAIDRTTPRFRFLESFRARSEAGAAIDMDLKADLAERLVEAEGSAEALIMALWRLAEANGWRSEAGRAERYLKSARRYVPSADLLLYIGWHGEPLGELIHDGSGWRWRADENTWPNPVRMTVPGALPPFIESLLPEGWLNTVINPKSDRDRLIGGRRYMSNIVVVQNQEEIESAVPDVLEGRLVEWSDSIHFTGRYKGPAPAFDLTLEHQLADIYRDKDTPRLSGVQIKAPMTLRRDGVLTAVSGSPFTHIMKPAPGAGYEELPIIEKACLDAAAACGFETPASALIAMPDGLPDALLVERFDIRRNVDDRRRLALEDMASIRGVPAKDKYQGSIEQVARALRPPVSTDWERDAELLIRRALFAWLIADGDWHLKNMAVLRVAEPNVSTFSSVALAPVYDVVTTRVFPSLEHDVMALTLNGKRNRLLRADFVQAAVTMKIPARRTERDLDEFATAFATYLDSLPPYDGRLGDALAIWRERLDAFRGA